MEVNLSHFLHQLPSVSNGSWIFLNFLQPSVWYPPISPNIHPKISKCAQKPMCTDSFFYPHRNLCAWISFSVHTDAQRFLCTQMLTEFTQNVHRMLQDAENSTAHTCCSGCGSAANDAAVHLHTQFEAAVANQHLNPLIVLQSDWFLRCCLGNKAGTGAHSKASLRIPPVFNKMFAGERRRG